MIETEFAEYPFRSNYFETGRGRMHYLDVGTGPVIVMVHGNPTWSYFYRHLITAMQENFRLIAVDHMGCGLSEKPQRYPYRLRNHVENLQALLNHLAIRRFSLVVHDWGGPIGIGAALPRVTDLESLVVMNTAAFRSRRMPWRIRLCGVPVVGEIIVRLCNGFAAAAPYMAVSRKMAGEIVHGYLAPYGNWHDRIAIHRFVRDIPLHPGHPSYPQLVAIEQGLETIRKNKIPMAIFWGGRDFCFDREFYREWCRRFPAAEQHYYSDFGHYLLEDGKDVLPPLIDTFFKTVLA